MKLYFNKNFELIKELDTEAYEGSVNYNKLYVYLDNEAYQKYATSGIYPTYATELPDGRRIAEVSTSIESITDTLDDVEYVGWGFTLIDRVLSVAGSVQLTISFKLKQTPTSLPTIIRSCKCVLFVHEAIISNEDVMFVETDDVNGLLKSFKQMLEQYVEAISNKMSVDGSNAAENVGLKQLSAEEIYVNILKGGTKARSQAINFGDDLYLEEQTEDKTIKHDIIGAKGIEAESVTTESITLTDKGNNVDGVLKVYDDTLYFEYRDEAHEIAYRSEVEVKADQIYVNKELSKKALKNGDSNEDFNVKKLSASEVATTKGSVEIIGDNEYSLVHKKYVNDKIEAEMKDINNHIRFKKGWFDISNGDILIPYRYKDSTNDELIEIETPFKETIITKREYIKLDDGKIYYKVTFADGTTAQVDASALTDTYGFENDSTSAVELSMNGNNFKADLSGDAKRLFREMVVVKNEFEDNLGYIVETRRKLEANYQVGGYKLEANADGTYTLDIKALNV